LGSIYVYKLRRQDICRRRMPGRETGLGLQTRRGLVYKMTRMNIFEALRTSHETQRQLADNLIRTAGDSPDRKLLFKELKRELAAHAAAEERFFYVPLIAHDMTQEPSRHGIAEHHQMDKLVETLEDTDPSSPHWIATAKELHHKIFHHLKDEEQGVFQLAGKVLSEAEKLSLAKGYEGEFVSQRTRE
jgi:hemerythrin-like domain-containing protein